jgi:hypothetical protein
MTGIVAKCFIAAIGVVDPGDPVVAIAGDSGGMVSFVGDGVKVIIVRYV